jgi:glycosyltransferase involved in cell wall biosynthesis
LPTGGAKRSLFEWTKRLSEKHILDLYGYTQRREEYLDIRPFMNECYFYDETLPLSTNYNIYKKLRLFIIISSLAKKIAKDIDYRKYDLVFVNHCTYIQSPLLLQYIKTPSLYFCQEPFRRVYEKRPLNIKPIGKLIKEIILRITDIWLKIIDRKSALSANIVLANSDFSGTMINNAYEIKAKTNYLGVDTKTFTPLLGVKKKYEIISVGRLDPIKGHDFIIKSLGMVEEDIRPNLRIICDSQDSSYRDELIKLSKAHRVICSFQQATGDLMPKIYNSALLTVYAPIREPLGLVPLESMACGVPTVAVGEGGINETVKHGETGVLVERKTDQLADAITVLVKDSKKRSLIVKNGIENVNNKWTWEKSTQMLEQHMLELLK